MGRQQENPPFCSREVALVVFLGGACTAIALLAISRHQVGNMDPDRWSLGHFGSYINGINSCWIFTPGLLAVSTEPHQLASLAPRVRKLRSTIMALGMLAGVVSLIAWQHWNIVMSALDQTCVVCCGLCTGLLGVWRGGWVAKTSTCFTLVAVATVVVEEYLEEYQPWPHAAFRCFAVLACMIAINGRLRLTSLDTLLVLGSAMVILWVGHIVLEAWLTRCWEKRSCEYLFQPMHYVVGVSRNLFAMLLFSRIASVVLREDSEEDYSSEDCTVDDEVTQGFLDRELEKE